MSLFTKLTYKNVVQLQFVVAISYSANSNLLLSRLSHMLWIFEKHAETRMGFREIRLHLSDFSKISRNSKYIVLRSGMAFKKFGKEPFNRRVLYLRFTISILQQYPQVHHIVWPREVYTQLCKYCLKFLYGFGGEISQLRVGLLKELTLTGGFLIQDLYTMTKWRDFIRQDTVTARALSDSVYNTQHLASAQLLKIASYTKETDLMFWNPQQTADNGVEIFNHKKLTVYSQRTKVEEVYSFPYKNRQLAALTGILIFYDYEYLPRTIGKLTWAEIIYIRYIRAIYTGDYDFAEELLDHYHMMVADFEAHRLSFKRDSFEILDSLWALVNFCRWEILWGFVQSSYLDEYHTPTLPINGPAVKLPTIQTLADLRITVITAKQPVHENVGERVFINTPICATNTEYTSYMRHVAAQKKSGVDTYWLRYYNTLADIVRTCGWFIKKTPEHAMLQIQTTLENYGLADILLRIASLSWQTLQYEGFPVHSQADGLTTNISKTLATQNPQKIVIGQYLLESAPIYKALLLTPITTVLKLTHHQKFKDFLYFWQQGTTTVRTVAREIDQRVNLATAAIVSRTNPIAITTTQYYKYNIDIATITQVYYINTFYTTIYQPTVEYSLDFTENTQAIISPFYGLINFINFFSNYYNVQVVDRIINFTTGVIELVKNTRHVQSVLAGQSTVVQPYEAYAMLCHYAGLFYKEGNPFDYVISRDPADKEYTEDERLLADNDDPPFLWTRSLQWYDYYIHLAHEHARWWQDRWEGWLLPVLIIAEPATEIVGAVAGARIDLIDTDILAMRLIVALYGTRFENILLGELDYLYIYDSLEDEAVFLLQRVFYYLTEYILEVQDIMDVLEYSEADCKHYARYNDIIEYYRYTGARELDLRHLTTRAERTSLRKIVKRRKYGINYWRLLVEKRHPLRRKRPARWLYQEFLNRSYVTGYARTHIEVPAQLGIWNYPKDVDCDYLLDNLWEYFGIYFIIYILSRIRNILNAHGLFLTYPGRVVVYAGAEIIQPTLCYNLIEVLLHEYAELVVTFLKNACLSTGRGVEPISEFIVCFLTIIEETVLAAKSAILAKVTNVNTQHRGRALRQLLARFFSASSQDLPVQATLPREFLENLFGSFWVRPQCYVHRYRPRARECLSTLQPHMLYQVWPTYDSLVPDSSLWYDYLNTKEFADYANKLLPGIVPFDTFANIVGIPPEGYRYEMAGQPRSDGFIPNTPIHPQDALVPYVHSSETVWGRVVDFFNKLYYIEQTSTASETDTPTTTTTEPSSEEGTLFLVGPSGAAWPDPGVREMDAALRQNNLVISQMNTIIQEPVPECDELVEALAAEETDLIKNSISDIEDNLVENNTTTAEQIQPLTVNASLTGSSTDTTGSDDTSQSDSDHETALYNEPIANLTDIFTELCTRRGIHIDYAGAEDVSTTTQSIRSREAYLSSYGSIVQILLSKLLTTLKQPINLEQTGHAQGQLEQLFENFSGQLVKYTNIAALRKLNRAAGITFFKYRNLLNKQFFEIFSKFWKRPYDTYALRWSGYLPKCLQNDALQLLEISTLGSGLFTYAIEHGMARVINKQAIKERGAAEELAEYRAGVYQDFLQKALQQDRHAQLELWIPDEIISQIPKASIKYIGTDKPQPELIQIGVRVYNASLEFGFWDLSGQWAVPSEYVIAPYINTKRWAIDYICSCNTPAEADLKKIMHSLYSYAVNFGELIDDRFVLSEEVIIEYILNKFNIQKPQVSTTITPPQPSAWPSSAVHQLTAEQLLQFSNHWETYSKMYETTITKAGFLLFTALYLRGGTGSLYLTEDEQLLRMYLETTLGKIPQQPVIADKDYGAEFNRLLEHYDEVGLLTESEVSEYSDDASIFDNFTQVFEYLKKHTIQHAQKFPEALLHKLCMRILHDDVLSDTEDSQICDVFAAGCNYLKQLQQPAVTSEVTTESSDDYDIVTSADTQVLITKRRPQIIGSSQISFQRGRHEVQNVQQEGSPHAEADVFRNFPTTREYTDIQEVIELTVRAQVVSQTTEEPQIIIEHTEVSTESDDSDFEEFYEKSQIVDEFCYESLALEDCVELLYADIVDVETLPIISAEPSISEDAHESTAVFAFTVQDASVEEVAIEESTDSDDFFERNSLQATWHEDTISLCEIEYTDILHYVHTRQSQTTAQPIYPRLMDTELLREVDLHATEFNLNDKNVTLLEQLQLFLQRGPTSDDESIDEPATVDMSEFFLKEPTIAELRKLSEANISVQRLVQNIPQQIFTLGLTGSISSLSEFATIFGRPAYENLQGHTLAAALETAGWSSCESYNITYTQQDAPYADIFFLLSGATAPTDLIRLRERMSGDLNEQKQFKQLHIYGNTIYKSSGNTFNVILTNDAQILYEVWDAFVFTPFVGRYSHITQERSAYQKSTPNADKLYPIDYTISTDAVKQPGVSSPSKDTPQNEAISSAPARTHTEIPRVCGKLPRFDVPRQTLRGGLRIEPRRDRFTGELVPNSVVFDDGSDPAYGDIEVDWLLFPAYMPYERPYKQPDTVLVPIWTGTKYIPVWAPWDYDGTTALDLDLTTNTDYTLPSETAGFDSIA